MNYTLYLGGPEIITICVIFYTTTIILAYQLGKKTGIIQQKQKDNHEQ